MTDLFTKQFKLFSEDAKKEKLMEQEKGKLDDIYGKTFAADSIHKRAVRHFLLFFKRQRKICEHSFSLIPS